jgi:hypothetical protein
MLSVSLNAPSTAGELIVIAVQLDVNGQVTSMTDDAVGPSSYTRLPASRANTVSTGVEMWFTQQANPGATTVTVESGGTLNSVVAWQFATPGTARWDVALALSNQPASTTPVAPQVTTASADEIILAATVVANDVSGIQAGSEFTNDTQTNSNGFAHLTDPQAPAGGYQAVWDQPSNGVYCSDAVAFAMGP